MSTDSSQNFAWGRAWALEPTLCAGPGSVTGQLCGPRLGLEVSGLSFLLHTVGLLCCLQASMRVTPAEGVEQEPQCWAWPLALDREKLVGPVAPGTT